MTSSFDGRVAIVTGGASGIGEATVRRLHAGGANVVVADVRVDAIASLTAELDSDRIVGHQVDMFQIDQIEAMIAAVTAHCGGLDILVNNAGIGSFGRVTDIDMAHWREVMAIDEAPLVRPAESYEVAAAIAFLASPDASYVNGHNLVVDGGGMAHTGLPNFTKLLGANSHLDGMARTVKRDSSGNIIS